MNMTENNDYTDYLQTEDEVEIDLMEYVRKLWAARKFLFKVGCIATVVGIVIALTTPKQYTANMTLAPEVGKVSGNGLSGIASILGVGGMNMGNDADALNVTLYPDIISSTPFILDLMDTQVKTINGEESDTTLVGYLTEYTDKSLMGTIISLPVKVIEAITSLFKSEKEGEQGEFDSFRLTKKQYQMVWELRENVVASVDKKTGVTTVSVTMQDPLVAAILTDTVVAKLQEHITKYRVSKAEDDCNYWEKLYQQRKEQYYDWQRKYAEYADANKNVILESVKIEQARLQNEVSLSYQVYSSVANQLQMAKAKVQEAKPVFAVVEPASVPLLPSGTSRKMILIGFVFLGIAAASAWILFGKDFWKKIKLELFGKKEEKDREE